jgi:hypothetical protein
MRPEVDKMQRMLVRIRSSQREDDPPGPVGSGAMGDHGDKWLF